MSAPLSDRTVLVTGGAGFVGSHLVESLHDDNEVRVLDDFSSGRRVHLPTDVDVIDGDVRDDDALAAAMQDVDCVFHQAAMVSVDESVRRPRACQATNAAATVSLLDHARLEDARVVLASSAAVYGPPEDVPIGERAPKRPQSPYGIAKLSADLHARRFADLYDLPTVALRYFNVYGPRQGTGDYSNVVHVFHTQARDGGPITIQGDGEQTRDFVHVDDVVQANRRAARTDATGEAFNVGTGRTVTIRELAERVRDLVGTDAEIVHEDPRPGDIQRSRADVSKATRLLGYEPTVDLADGLADLIDADAMRSDR